MAGCTGRTTPAISPLPIPSATRAPTSTAVPLGILQAKSGAPFRTVASLPNPRCGNCRFAVGITIAAFKGPGSYNTAEVQANPGGDRTTGDYGDPTACNVVVKDEFDGTFRCQALNNHADQTKTIDMSGAWQAPAP